MDPRHCIHTRRSRPGWLWPLIAISMLLAVYGWATSSDERAADELVAQETQRAAAYEAGKHDGREEILAALREGRQEDMAAMPLDGCAGMTLVGRGGRR